MVSGHITSCPRAVKFADALTTAGHDILLVSAPTLREVVPLDEALAAGKSWRHAPCSDKKLLRDQLRAKVAPIVWARKLARDWAASWCGGIAYGALLRAASSVQNIDLVLAFNLPALAVALDLNASRGWPFHFDAEDDHVEMLPDVPEHRSERSRRQHLMQRCADRAVSLTTAAPIMAERMTSRS